MWQLTKSSSVRSRETILRNRSIGDEVDGHCVVAGAKNAWIDHAAESAYQRVGAVRAIIHRHKVPLTSRVALKLKLVKSEESTAFHIIPLGLRLWFNTPILQYFYRRIESKTELINTDCKAKKKWPNRAGQILYVDIHRQSSLTKWYKAPMGKDATQWHNYAKLQSNYAPCRINLLWMLVVVGNECK